MFMIIVGAVALLVVGLLVLAATRPRGFNVERSIRVDAPPEAVFPLINDFHRWDRWSPWEKVDPAMTRSYSGAERGRGAVYEWAGNSKVGAGRMEITDSTPPNSLTVKLDFLRPFEGHNVASFAVDPLDDASRVTWAMRGPSPYMMRVMGLFVSMDKLVGKDFEKGLVNLKAVAEVPAARS